jgi:hypothetical protein
MVNDKMPQASKVEETAVEAPEIRDGLVWRKFFLRRKGTKELIPAVGLRGADSNGTVVVWIHPEGKSSLVSAGKLVPAARQILAKKAAILAIDAYCTGEIQGGKGPSVDKNFAGFTFGYNRTLLAERVHDILTAVAYARGHKKTRTVDLVGFDKAGPWVVLARALCGDGVRRTAADLARFRFDKITSTADDMMLPGAVKYGGMGAFVALCAPGELLVHNHQGTGIGKLAQAGYQNAASSRQITLSGEKKKPAKVIDWILR